MPRSAYEADFGPTHGSFIYIYHDCEMLGQDEVVGLPSKQSIVHIAWYGMYVCMYVASRPHLIGQRRSPRPSVRPPWAQSEKSISPLTRDCYLSNSCLALLTICSVYYFLLEVPLSWLLIRFSCSQFSPPSLSLIQQTSTTTQYTHVLVDQSVTLHIIQYYSEILVASNLCQTLNSVLHSTSSETTYTATR